MGRSVDFKAQHGIVPWLEERLSNEIGTPRTNSAATSTALDQNDALEAVIVARPSDTFHKLNPDLFFGSKLFVLECSGLERAPDLVTPRGGDNMAEQER